MQMLLKDSYLCFQEPPTQTVQQGVILTALPPPVRYSF